MIVNASIAERRDRPVQPAAANRYVVLACYDTITADLSKQGRMNKLFGSIFD